MSAEKIPIRNRAFRILAFSAVAAGALLGASQFRNYLSESQEERRRAAIQKLKNKLPIQKETLPTRREQIESLKKGNFDIFVIGGGSVGSGVALDSVTRGFNTALVERDDFASGTSSRSTKLIHGGVRYLEKAVWSLDRQSFALVWEALQERKVMMNNAPYLTNALPIMTPCFKWWEIPYFWTGMKMYDILAASQRLHWSYFLSKSKSLKEFPMLASSGLKGTIVYYDGQMDDARVNVSLALTAASYGATVANHVAVVGIEKDSSGIARKVKLRDNLTGEQFSVNTKCIINCGGPFTDEIRKLDSPDSQNMIIPSSGVHVILPTQYSPETTGLIVPKTKDGRVVFMLPWLGKTIAGTTEGPTPITDLPQPHENEISFILDALSDYLSVPVRRSDVLAAWSGIRPLARQLTDQGGESNTKDIVRDHVINVSPSKVINVAGGKWTTYRKMAQDAVDSAIATHSDVLQKKNPCATKWIQIIGSEGWTPNYFALITQNFQRLKKVDKSKQQQLVPIETDIAQHLSRAYGTNAMKVVNIAQKQFGNRLHENYPFLEAEVIYSAQHEMACNAVDVLARRLRLAFLDARVAHEVTPRVVEILGQHFKWDQARRNEELERARTFINTMNASGRLQTSR